MMPQVVPRAGMRSLATISTNLLAPFGPASECLCPAYTVGVKGGLEKCNSGAEICILGMSTATMPCLSSSGSCFISLVSGSCFESRVYKTQNPRVMLKHRASRFSHYLSWQGLTRVAGCCTCPVNGGVRTGDGPGTILNLQGGWLRAHCGRTNMQEHSSKHTADGHSSPAGSLPNAPHICNNSALVTR